MTPAGVPRAPTIYDVAARAGVSSQTVHRHVRGFEGIRPATRSRVQQAIDELGWRPNALARALRTSTGNRILLFVHELDESGPSSIVVAASRRAREAGFVLEVVPLDAEDIEASAEILRSIDQTYVAGVLAFAPTEQLVELFDRHPFSVPVVKEINGDGLAGEPAQGDEEPGTLRIVEHLHSLGHRRLFLLNGPPGWFSSAKRRAAAVGAAHDLGLEIVGEAAGDWSAASGHRIASGRLGDATAVVAANDEMAIGAMAALAGRGLRVPEDLSVTGFDDIALAAYSVPALTTVRSDFRRSGEQAVERLLRRFAGDDRAPDASELFELVVRASTGAVAPQE